MGFLLSFWAPWSPPLGTPAVVVAVVDVVGGGVRSVALVVVGIVVALVVVGIVVGLVVVGIVVGLVAVDEVVVAGVVMVLLDAGGVFGVEVDAVVGVVVVGVIVVVDVVVVDVMVELQSLSNTYWKQQVLKCIKMVGTTFDPPIPA